VAVLAEEEPIAVTVMAGLRVKTVKAVLLQLA
jgi:hypothetical protein